MQYIARPPLNIIFQTYPTELKHVISCDIEKRYCYQRNSRQHASK